jgi:hypothetical protein
VTRQVRGRRLIPVIRRPALLFLADVIETSGECTTYAGP